MAVLVSRLPPCVLHEDEHLLVVSKPAGLNTHAPSAHAGEGIYDWLRNREPRWAALSILHRLDKETSGVLVFGKTPLANRSLTGQFTDREVRKRYLLLTDRPVPGGDLTVESTLVRVGEKYLSRPRSAAGEHAVTRFRVLGVQAGRTLVEADPLTGRTHQIRVHAADRGFPILGDILYGGTPGGRVCLHATEINFRHPETGQEVSYTAAEGFQTDPAFTLRRALIDESETNAFRVMHGAADRWPGVYAERLGDFLLVQSAGEPDESLRSRAEQLSAQWKLRGAVHKFHSRQASGRAGQDASPRPWFGEAPPEEFPIQENGIRFQLSFNEGYSYGLFLDQRDNRRRLLTNHIAAGFPLFDGGPGGFEALNTFAYTCGFSVCAAKAGARVTSLDLSRKYLDWGKRNFAANELDPAAHDFIYGDVFDWLRRLRKKGRVYGLVLLDPPTFSQSKESGAFRAEKDYGKLVESALPLVKPGGVLFASTNAALLEPETFLETARSTVTRAGRKITREFYAPQPPDFPITRQEPGYLKTAWFRVT